MPASGDGSPIRDRVRVCVGSGRVDVDAFLDILPKSPNPQFSGHPLTAFVP